MIAQSAILTFYLLVETAIIGVQFKIKNHDNFQTGDFYLFKVFQTLKIKRKRMKNKKYLLNDQKMRNKSLSCTASELLMMRIKLENDQNFEKLGLGSCPCNKKKHSFQFPFLSVWSLTPRRVSVNSVFVIPFLLMHFLSLFSFRLITYKTEKGHIIIVESSLVWKRQIECRTQFYSYWLFCF